MQKSGGGKHFFYDIFATKPPKSLLIHVLISLSVFKEKKVVVTMASGFLLLSVCKAIWS